MKKVLWVPGKNQPTYRRELSAADVQRLGASHAKADLVFSRENGFTLELSNEVSDSLVEKLPEEFVIVDDKEAEEVKEAVGSVEPRLTRVQEKADESSDELDDRPGDASSKS